VISWFQILLFQMQLAPLHNGPFDGLVGVGAAADAARSAGRLRLRAPADVVTLPARIPGNLPGVVVEKVERPVSEVGLLNKLTPVVAPQRPGESALVTQLLNP
jgi:hypothetical protein